jgi:hypothetical protein
VLIDTGPLVATCDRNDQYHEACMAAIRSIAVPCYTCWPVITEAAYLLRDSPRSVIGLLRKIEDGDLLILPLSGVDVPAISQILSAYEDQALDFVDACLLHLANRDGLDTVCTLDRRHFSVLRTLHGSHLNMIP